MSRLEDALTWSGSGAVVSVFVATPVGTDPALDLVVGDIRPSSTSVFRLEQDPPRPWPRLDVDEFDAGFDALPAGLDDYVGTVLQRALDLGAVVAWCAFEGSFHFEHLLTDDVAQQVYAVAAPEVGVCVRLDDAARTHPAWLWVVRSARAAPGIPR